MRFLVYLAEKSSPTNLPLVDNIISDSGCSEVPINHPVTSDTATAVCAFGDRMQQHL